MDLYKFLIGRWGRKRRLEKASEKAIQDFFLRASLFNNAALARQDVADYLTDMQITICAELTKQFRGEYTPEEMKGIVLFTMARILNQFMLRKGGTDKQ
jgi:hypothetical protein